MVFTDLSPSMNLPVPEVGIDPGPTYAQDVNNCLTIIDGHNHAPGYGVQITPSGLNINADLTFINNNLTNARSVRFFSQNAVLSNPADLGCLYEVGADLYFNDGVGNQIRITQSGGVAGTPGSIANLTPPASASYVSLNSTFVWQSAANTAANMDAGSLILRNLTANSFGLTLSPPNALGADYDITLPSLPGSTLPVSISSSGAMSAAPITFAQLDSSLQTRVSGVPTVQRFLSGTGTYTTPAGVNYLKIRMVGGGGGGGGISGGVGGTGGDTTFGANLTASGATGVIGGAASIGGGITSLVSLPGANGNGNAALFGGVNGQWAGGSGASSPFGGAGAAISTSSGSSVAGGSAVANSGSGGGGASTPTGTDISGLGGGAGGYIEAIISSPAGTYAYTVGAGGTGGAGGGGGGPGGSGIIIVEEHYGS